MQGKASQQKKQLVAKVQALKAGEVQKGNPKKEESAKQSHRSGSVKEGQVKQKHLPDQLKQQTDRNELIRTVETSLSDPSSRMAFEKQILMQPNDVELWIQYITYVFESE
jgi:hypothetical protein